MIVSVQHFSYMEPHWMSQVLAAVSPLVGLEDGMISTTRLKKMTKNIPDFLSVLKKGQATL